MITPASRCLLLLLAMLALAARADEAASLEGQVAAWVRLRTEIAAEQTAGREQAAALAREEELLRREVDALSATVAQLRAASTTVQQADAAVSAEVESLRAETGAWNAAVTNSAAALRAWVSRLPPGLERELDDALAAHDQATDPAVRAAALAAGWGKLRALSRSFHVKSALVTVSAAGTRRLDILYSGLSRAWAVSPDRTHAALGEAGPTGWTWREASPEARATIARALDVASRKAAPALLRLPMRAGGAP